MNTTPSAVPVADDASAHFARHLRRVRFGDLSPGDVTAARQSILDTIAVMLAGSGASSARAVVRMLDAWGGAPEALAIGTGKRLPAVHAAFANGAMAHQFDFDDTHDAAVVHPTANSFAAALAVCEALGGQSGKDLLAAVVVANDIACRLGLALTGNLFEYAWTRPPVIGTFAATAAAARLLDLDEDATRSAFGLTLHQACNTLECLYAPGSDVRGLRDGFSVRNGVTAAYMAREGVHADHSAFEGRFGLFNAFFRGDYRRAPLFENLGTAFEGTNVSIKPWPSARETHATIHAALSLVRDHAIAPEGVARVTLTVGRANLEFCEPGSEKRRPQRRMDALSSLPFAVAVALRHGRVSLASYTDDAIAAPDVLALVDRIGWTLDESIEEGIIEGGRVRVEMTDGQTFEAHARHAYGHPGEPLPPSLLRDKLTDCVAMMEAPFDAARVDRIVEVVTTLEERPVDDLVAALSGRT